MKTIIFARHAKPTVPFSGPNDSVPLAPEGRTVQKVLFGILQERNLRPHKIYCSPLLRAVQSAKILADEWELPICEEPSLGNDFDAERVLQLASEAEDDATLLFLGHGGPMDQLVETLAGEPLLPSGLPKSGAIILTFPAAIEAGAAKGHELLNPGAG